MHPTILIPGFIFSRVLSLPLLIQENATWWVGILIVAQNLIYFKYPHPRGYASICWGVWLQTFCWLICGGYYTLRNPTSLHFLGSVSMVLFQTSSLVEYVSSTTTSNTVISGQTVINVIMDQAPLQRMREKPMVRYSLIQHSKHIQSIRLDSLRKWIP